MFTGKLAMGEKFIPSRKSTFSKTNKKIELWFKAGASYSANKECEMEFGTSPLQNANDIIFQSSENMLRDESEISCSFDRAASNIFLSI